MLLLRMLDKEAERRPSSAEVAAAMAATGSALTVDRRVSAAAPAATRKLVGRLKALGELQAALQSISEGRGLLACVSGEAGIGKSALVGEFLSVAATSGAYFVAHGRCSERRREAKRISPCSMP